MDRLFLDANVLFSAAYRDGSGQMRLWRLRGARLVTSAYALEEARRNCDTAERRRRLEKLPSRIEIVPHSIGLPELPRRVELPADDRPILAAAVAARATHLLTGDRRAFGRYFGQRIGGVLILRPADYLRDDRHIRPGHRP